MLARIASGWSYKEIASEMCLSARTIERHSQNIQTKLGVRNKTEAATWAIRNGFGP